MAERGTEQKIDERTETVREDTARDDSAKEEVERTADPAPTRAAENPIDEKIADEDAGIRSDTPDIAPVDGAAAPEGIAAPVDEIAEPEAVAESFDTRPEQEVPGLEDDTQPSAAAEETPPDEFGDAQPDELEDLFDPAEPAVAGGDLGDPNSLDFDESMRDGADTAPSEGDVADPATSLEPDAHVGPGLPDPQSATADGNQRDFTGVGGIEIQLLEWNDMPNDLFIFDKDGEITIHFTEEEEDVWVNQETGQEFTTDDLEAGFEFDMSGTLEAAVDAVYEFFFGEGEDMGPDGELVVAPPGEIDADDPEWQAQQAGRNGDIDFGEDDGAAYSSDDMSYDGVDHGMEYVAPDLDRHEAEEAVAIDPLDDPAVDPGDHSPTGDGEVDLVDG